MAAVNQLIQDFYRVAQQRDFARDFSFRLLAITPGDASSITFNQDDLVYIKTASLPGRDLQNVEVPYMGLKFNVPGSVVYPDSGGYELTFYADQNSKIRQQFEQWSRDIFDDASSTGNYFTPKQTSTIDMVQLDPQMNAIGQYQLVGVAVNKVGNLEYKPSEGTGTVIDFKATITYHFWTRSKPAPAVLPSI